MEDIFLFLLLMTSTLATEQNTRPFITAPNSDLDTFNSFSPLDSSTYRTLTLSDDSSTIHIGGKDKVFGQKAVDITKNSYLSVAWPVMKDDRCAEMPDNDGGKKCSNVIQVIQPLNKTHILICGSNSLTPKNKYLVRENENQGFLLVDDDVRDPLCSCNPDEIVSSLMIPPVNGDIFSTRRSDSQSEISLVKSMPPSLLFSKKETGTGIITIVSSFSAIDHVMDQQMAKVYFVSDEKVVEPGFKTEYAPTITQVCANDMGGKEILTNKWTSLLKVRLLCQSGDDYPLTFDQVTDMVIGSDQILFGTFTTRHETSRTNVVCAFRLPDVQKAFNEAMFWSKDTATTYKKIDSPKLRPGICAYPGMIPETLSASTSKDFPASHLGFMNSNYLVADIVKPAYPALSGKPLTRTPLLLKAGGKFTKIAVEQVTSRDGTSFDIVFVGGEDGSIYKFVAVQKDDEIETVELAKYQPSSYPILSMKISQKHGFVYVGTNKGVHQISTSNCAAYTKSCIFCDPCHMCILSRDPSCAWDGKECVSIKNITTSHDFMQDVVYGDASAQCNGLPESQGQGDSKKINNGATEIFGNVVKNPNVVFTWYIVQNPSKKQKITDESGKYRITTDGQLEITNFNADSDGAKYECQYTVNSYIVNVTVYDVKGSPYIPPIITVSPATKSSSTGMPKTNGTVGPNTATDSHTTTSALPIAESNLEIGLVIGSILFVCIVIIVVLLIHRCRRKKYSPSKVNKREKRNSDAIAMDSSGNDNKTDNNNIHRTRIQSEFDGRERLSLLASHEHQLPVNSAPEIQFNDLPTASQRNAKSLDDLNERDTIDYIDDDAAASDEYPSRELTGSIREKTGRKRVPPARTKSMPGSALYVMFGGKKLKCSTLQRNREGTWTIEVRPNQSVMEPLDQDEIIDILDDSETMDTMEKFHGLDNESSKLTFQDGTPKTKSTTALQNAESRRAFFGVDSSKPSADRSHVVHAMYMTSTPNNTDSKPFRNVDNTKQPLTEQPSQASFGQNSSEERDSDTTVKGSSMTLQQEDTPSILRDKTQTPTRYPSPSTHEHIRNSSRDEFPTHQPTSDVPSSSNKKRKNKAARDPIKRNGCHDSSNKSLDRSSGSSDGDEQLHGRDKNVTRKSRKLLDSPSKESRTSQGSSSSGDYRSARSSVISEQSSDQR